MRISGLLASLLAVLLLISGNVYAAGDCVVGYVDIDTISKESVASKALHSQFQKKQEELQSLIHEQEESLKKKIEDLEKKRSVMAAEAFSKLYEEVEQAKKLLADNVTEYRSFLEKNYLKSVQAISETSKKVIAEVASKEKLGFIVAKNGLLYPAVDSTAKELKDVTSSVLETMDKIIPTFKVEFEGEETLQGLKKKGVKDDKAGNDRKGKDKESGVKS